MNKIRNKHEKIYQYNTRKSPEGINLVETLQVGIEKREREVNGMHKKGEHIRTRTEKQNRGHRAQYDKLKQEMVFVNNHIRM